MWKYLLCIFWVSLATLKLICKPPVYKLLTSGSWGKNQFPSRKNSLCPTSCSLVGYRFPTRWRWGGNPENIIFPGVCLLLGEFSFSGIPPPWNNLVLVVAYPKYKVPIIVFPNVEALYSKYEKNTSNDPSNANGMSILTLLPANTGPMSWHKYSFLGAPGVTTFPRTITLKHIPSVGQSSLSPNWNRLHR